MTAAYDTQTGKPLYLDRNGNPIQNSIVANPYDQTNFDRNVFLLTAAALGGAGAYGAAGAGGASAASGATNPALIESASGTAGYGASSAGAGGAAAGTGAGGAAVSADAAGDAASTQNFWNGVDFSGSTPMKMSSSLGGGGGMDLWGSLINLGGSYLQSQAAGRAADAQSAGAVEAARIAAQQRQPWVDAGKGALDRLTKGLQPGGEFAQKFSMADALNSPAYKEALRGGMEAIQNSAAAKGGLLSSNTMQDLTKFGEATAAQFENQAFNQWLAQQQQLLAPVQSLAQVGQTEVNQVADTGANAALAAAAARSGAISAQGNIWGSALSNQANQYQQYQLLNQILGGGSTGTGLAANDPYGSGIDQTGYLGGPSTAGDFSDRRLKSDVRRVGHTDEGLPIYTYKMGDGPRRMGVMAQEVMKSKPEAVSAHPTGFLMVDYDKVA